MVTDPISTLDALEKFLRDRNATLTFVTGLIVAVSGWVAFFLQRWRRSHPTLTIEAENGEIFIINHGEATIELLQSSITLRDPSSRPDLAQRQTLVLSLDGALTGNSRRLLTKIDDTLITEVRKITDPMVTAAEKMLPNSICAHFVEFTLHLRWVMLGRSRIRTKEITRWLSGHPRFGWGLSYGPYHHEMQRPVRRKLRRVLQWILQSLREPGRVAERWGQQRNLQTMLDVHGILKAASTKVITGEQAETRLRALAKHLKVSPEDLLQRFAPEVLGETTEGLPGPNDDARTVTSSESTPGT